MPSVQEGASQDAGRSRETIDKAKADGRLRWIVEDASKESQLAGFTRELNVAKILTLHFCRLVTWMKQRWSTLSPYGLYERYRALYLTNSTK